MPSPLPAIEISGHTDRAGAGGPDREPDTFRPILYPRMSAKEPMTEKVLTFIEKILVEPGDRRFPHSVYRLYARSVPAPC